MLSIAEQLTSMPHWVKEVDMPTRCEKVNKGQRMREIYDHMVALNARGVLQRSTVEVAIDLKTTGTVASHALRRLAHEGRLVKVGEVKRGGTRVAIWQLAEEGAK